MQRGTPQWRLQIQTACRRRERQTKGTSLYNLSNGIKKKRDLIHKKTCEALCAFCIETETASRWISAVTQPVFFRRTSALILCLQTERLCVAESHTSGGPSTIISCWGPCVHKFLPLPPCFSSKKKRGAWSFVMKNVWSRGQTAWYSALWQASKSLGLLWSVVN